MADVFFPIMHISSDSFQVNNTVLLSHFLIIFTSSAIEESKERQQEEGTTIAIEKGIVCSFYIT